MTALIAENVVYDVRCSDPGCTRPIGEGITSRAEAETIADAHDLAWHTPQLEDVPVLEEVR